MKRKPSEALGAIITCSSPSEDAGNIALNPSCRAEAICHLTLIGRPINFFDIQTPYWMYSYKSETIKTLVEYASSLSRIKYEVLNYVKCLHGLQGCSNAQTSFFVKMFSLYPYPGLIYTDPVGAFLKVVEEELKARLLRPGEALCGSCLKAYREGLKKLKKTLAKTTLIRGWLNDRSQQYYELCFRFSKTARRHALSDVKRMALPPDWRVLEEYLVPPFKVKVLQATTSDEVFYFVKNPLRDWRLKYIINDAVRVLNRKLRTSFSIENYSLDSVISCRKAEALNLLRPMLVQRGLKDYTLEELAALASYKSVGLMKLMPFLLDDNVEEFFLDKPSSYVYLDLRRWGRARSNISLTEGEVNRVVTHIKSESGFPLDYENPSLKSEVITKDFHVRVSIDISPLAVDGVTLDFRKLKSRSFLTIVDLVRNGTLTVMAASYIVFNLLKKRSILIYGEPGSGKTTLMNALDLILPASVRKVYCEDVIETIPQIDEFGRHQLRYHVDPLEALREGTSKQFEVLKTLHRAPDYLILGEVQHKLHSQALFQGLSAGLRVLATTHSSTAEQLMSRFIFHHEIPITCLYDLDLLVQMKRLPLSSANQRRLVRIVEVEPRPPNVVSLSLNTVKLVDVFLWDPSGRLRACIDLYDAPSIRKIAAFEPLNRKSFNDVISSVASTIEELIGKDVGIRDVLSAFERLYAEHFMYVTPRQEVVKVKG
ncbi:MAG: ATPase, T2SS/T4P/T4SS family [Candidatus Nezhaarchaeales archaeon]